MGYQSGTYKITIANTVNFDVWNVIINVESNFNGYESLDFGNVNVTVISAMRESQETIDTLHYLYETAKTTLVIEPPPTSGAFESGCTTASEVRCLSLSGWLRGYPVVNAWASASVPTTLWGKIWGKLFGSKKLIVVVIFPDGSTVKYKLMRVFETIFAFDPVANSATNPDGSPRNPNNTSELTNGVNTGGGGTNGISLGSGGVIIVGGSSTTCTWWKFVTTQNGQVISISYKCVP